MNSSDQDWNADFPMEEEVEDHAGNTRTFVITCHEGALGFTIRAVEKDVQGTGYEFAAYSETSPYSALGRLRQKMHRGLALRHITRSRNNEFRMLHDKLSGRITSDHERGVVLIVDGIPLSIDEFASILASHEGWNFEMTITDSLE